MPIVTVAGRVHETGLEVLRRHPGIEIDVVEDPAPEALAEALRSSDALLLRITRVTAAMIEGAQRLKIVSRHGVGYDNVDVAALTARGIPLAVAATSNMVAVAEHTLFMMLELAKRGRPFDAGMRSGDWALRDRLRPFELSGKTLLIVGFGRIGSRVAARALPFDMRVLVVDPYVPRERIAAAGCERVASLEEGLALADIVSLHVPLGAETRGMIGRDALARMRRGALLINTARGGLMDEAAVAEAVRSGHLGGAGIDAFEEEPPPAGQPLLAPENVLLSPHIAGVTAEAALRMAQESAANIVAAFEGRLDPAVVVNPEVLSR
jgi:D-3-phosphoglycerate dehydrogenase